jgi:hypothetical protein
MPEFTDAATCGTEDYVSRQKGGLLLAEYARLVVDERKLLKLRKREEHPNCENHCADATLYPWRRTYPYLSKVLPKPPPKIGSPEWLHAETERRQKEEDELLAQELAYARRRREEQDEFAAFLGYGDPWAH